MSIKHRLEKIKQVVSKDTVLIPTLIILVGFAGFGLGQLSLTAGTTPQIRIEQADWLKTEQGAQVIEITGKMDAGAQERGRLVGSANSDVYHFPWCSGAQRISEENKVWFQSTEEARAQGYRPAKNCKGLD